MNETTVMLKELIENMIQEYRENASFSNSSLELIMNLADFQDYEVSRLINKFHYINTEITSNGGVPVLKQIYNMIQEVQ